MKRIVIILCAIMLSSMAFGQMQPPPGGPGRSAQEKEKMRQQRQERLYEQLKTDLGLDREQAEKFAPIYQQYKRESNNVNKELKNLLDEYKGKDIDDKTAVFLVKAQLDAEADIVNIKREYMKVFKKYLNPDQLAKIFLAEKRGGRGHRGPGMNGRPDNRPTPEAELAK
ncbi:MAG: hypothetical protein KBS95_00555 [Alistipes sp.]|nr:hypothetical protein [Candidatus Alistipes equi]